MTNPAKVFVGALGAEVNTFSPLLIDESRFQEVSLYRAGEIPSKEPVPLIAAPLRRVRELENEHKIEIVQGLCAGAQPGGFVTADVYESLRDELLGDLQRAGDVDIVVLGLHGATAAVGYDDCDGDILSKVRNLVGDETIVAAVLDPHCHLTEEMISAANLLVAYKEYPHTDIFETSDHLVDLAFMCAFEGVRPSTAAFRCGSMQIIHTSEPKPKELLEQLRKDMSSSDVLDISIAHGFAWGDTQDTGTAVWAITNNDLKAAKEIAKQYAQRVTAMREECRSPIITTNEAIDAIKCAPPGLVVVADSADNPGGGAPSDATYLISEFLKAGIENLAAGLIWDPIAIDLCKAAGEGSTISLRIGGKVSRMSGEPLDLDVVVGKTLESATQEFAGGIWPVGDAVAIHQGTNAYVLTSNRAQCFSPDLFYRLNIDVREKRVVVVKSSQHFHAGFAPLAAQVLYVEGQGALGDIRLLPYEKIKRPIWPLDDFSETSITPIASS